MRGRGPATLWVIFLRLTSEIDTALRYAVEKLGGGQRAHRIRVGGMCCAGCALHVRG